MKISTLLKERLKKQQRAVDVGVLDYELANTEQALTELTLLIEQRKGVNAGVGKARKAGNDASQLIEQSRQLSSAITAAEQRFEGLLQRIAPLQEASRVQPSEPRTHQCPGQFRPYPLNDQNSNQSSGQHTPLIIISSSGKISYSATFSRTRTIWPL